jgi:hypothetical protein
MQSSVFHLCDRGLKRPVLDISVNAVQAFQGLVLLWKDSGMSHVRSAKI